MVGGFARKTCPALDAILAEITGSEDVVASSDVIGGYMILSVALPIFNQVMSSMAEWSAVGAKPDEKRMDVVEAMLGRLCDGEQRLRP